MPISDPPTISGPDLTSGQVPFGWLFPAHGLQSYPRYQYQTLGLPDVSIATAPTRAPKLFMGARGTVLDIGCGQSQLVKLMLVSRA